jgi:dTDP-4-dehydrorhamnose 3,5-epimerase
MKVSDLGLPGVKLIEPHVHEDARGFFTESWNARDWAAAGLDLTFVQENHSGSARGVLRGLHYQVRRPQGKLVRAVRGRAYDVCVDMRAGLPTFGRWAAAELSGDNRRMLWIPPGLAHGFLALEDGTELLYKCTEYYAPELERSLLWSDPAVGIEWPLAAGRRPILSEKDAAGALLVEAEPCA